MAEPTESALDDRLRRVARRAVDDASASVDIEADLARLHWQLGDRHGRDGPNARTSRRWLGAAAAVAFLGAAIVVVVVSQDDDNIQISSPSTSVVGVPTSTVPSAPVTTGTATTLPPTTSTTAPGLKRSLWRRPFPAVAAPLQLVSVTASEMVATCFTNPTAIAVVEDGALRQVGTLATDGALVPDTAPVAGCEGVAPNVDHTDVRIPPTLEPGDYVICLAGLDVAPGCAAITVGAWADSCFDAPIAPPGLTDGSEPGEPVAEGDLVTWGSGRVSVSQVVGTRPDQTWVSPSGGWRAGSYEVLPSEPGANVLSIIGGPDFCPRRYTGECRIPGGGDPRARPGMVGVPRRRDPRPHGSARGAPRTGGVLRHSERHRSATRASSPTTDSLPTAPTSARSTRANSCGRRRASSSTTADGSASIRRHLRTRCV